MSRLLLLILLALPSAAAAQGLITGKLVDAAGGSEYLDDAALAGVVALPDSAPAFNEITAMQWQDAFTAFSKGEEPLVPLGGVINTFEVSASRFAVLEGDGTFRIEDVPLGSRLGLAVKVGDLWWPYAQELKLTEEVQSAHADVSYYRLGADPGSVAMEKHYLEVQGQVRDDLKYSPIRMVETLRFTNTDPTRAALVDVELPIAVPPTMSAQNLSTMYGSLLFYMQGWNASTPTERDFAEQAQAAWSFGVGGGMHGGALAPSSEPRFSAPNWHFLNRDPMLAMAGAGDTLYSINPSPSGRSASLIFRRPVPPAGERGNGVLEIRVMHGGGVLHLDPGGKLAIKRSFPYSVRTCEARVTGGVTLAALVEGAHRRYYGLAEGDTARVYPPNPDVETVLKANEQVSIILGFDADSQTLMEAIETGEPLAPRSEPTEEPEGKQIDRSMIFKALAVMFGLAFVGALVATVRKPRDEQLKRLAELPASRAEVVNALVELEAEYKKGALPARVYKEERARILNRLVDYDARDEGADKEDE